MLNLTNSSWIRQCASQLNITDAQCLNLILSHLHREHGLPKEGQSIHQWLGRAGQTHRELVLALESLRGVTLPLTETLKSIRLYTTQLHYARPWTSEDALPNQPE
jgi:hypothetical protein